MANPKPESSKTPVTQQDQTKVELPKIVQLGSNSTFTSAPAKIQLGDKGK